METCEVWILTRVARLFILSVAVLEVQFGKSLKRESYLGEYGFVGHKHMVLALSRIK